MLVAMWIKANPGDLQPWNSSPRRSIYIVSREGSERRWLTFFGHHHSWTANGTQVLYSGFMEHTDDGVRQQPRLYLIDFDGGNKRVVIDQPLGGHPIASPDGSLITTWDDQGVILVDLGKQKVEYLAMLEPSFDMTHYGTHPHCIWRHDGGAILYNSAQSGHSQLYQVAL
jgi:Tol biopolymer transport system component